MKVVLVDVSSGKARVADELWPPVNEGHVLIQVIVAALSDVDDKVGVGSGAKQ